MQCIHLLLYVSLNLYLITRPVIFEDKNKKWEGARTSMLDFLSPGSIKDFDQMLQEETQRIVDQLIKLSQHHGSVDPLPLLQCASLNAILPIVFGHPNEKSLNDSPYKFIANLNAASLTQRYTSFWNKAIKFFPVMSYLIIMFRDQYKRRAAVNASYPLVRKLIQRARKNKGDNLVKRIDLLKEEYDIDEQHITLIMSKLKQRIF